ncbi:MAG: DUF4093 domain-containing protein, partial [Oscillospiraceae bacterium]
LGVEGVTSESIINALLQAGVGEKPQRSGRDITYNDLYTLGISGGQGSAEKRRALLLRVGLPARLSKKALREVLSNLYSYEELEKLLSE